MPSAFVDPVPPPARVPKALRARRGTRAAREVTEPAWLTEVPTTRAPMVRDLAAAFIAYPSNWHEAFLALSGSLLERGVPVEMVPAIVGAVAVDAKDDRPEDRYKGAQTTIGRWQAHHHYKGFAALRRIDPRIAETLQRHTLTAPEQRVQVQAQAAEASTPGATPVEMAVEGIERAVRIHRYGALDIEAGCGVGKSQATLRIAYERSLVQWPKSPETQRPKRRLHNGELVSSDETATENAPEEVDEIEQSARAPPGSKTAISVPTHELAMQHTESLRARGAKVLRVFGPLSVKRADGEPECRFHTAGTALAEGGQSVTFELCFGRTQKHVDRCEYWDECRARGGVDADEGARITVGPHAKLKELMGEAGATGLLVIDEPPSPIKEFSFVEDDFANHARAREDFVPSYWAITQPVVLAAAAALASGSLTDSTRTHSIRDVLALGWSAVPEHVVREALVSAGDDGPLEGTDTLARVIAVQRSAMKEDTGRTAPLLKKKTIVFARSSPFAAKRSGRASALVHALYRAAIQVPDASLRITEYRGPSRLSVSLIDHDYAEALRRSAPTVILDADLTLQHPIVELVSGGPVKKLRFVAPDGAKCTRELWLEPQARKRHWLAGPEDARWPAWEKGPRRAIEQVVERGRRAGSRRVAIITVIELADCLRVALGQKPRREVPETVAEEARRLIGPIFGRAPSIVWEIGHYGSMRGLDRMKTCDGLATILDPVPNLGSMQHEVNYYGSTFAIEEYVDIKVATELEQAHGRLRLPHRMTETWGVHIGTTLPRGYGWSGDGFTTLRGWRRQEVVVMTVEELLGLRGTLSTRAYAAATGLTAKQLDRYLDGSATMSDDIATLLRAHAQRTNHPATSTPHP